jgi:SAM-dependent methyltransferase
MKKSLIDTLKIPAKRLRDLYRTHVRTRANLRKNAGMADRRLDIGPGESPAKGFECLNVVPSPCTDYVLDAIRPLPFPTGTFDIVHASHVLEHIPWFESERVLAEWVRIIRPGGGLEIWVPDGYKLCKLLVDLNEGRPSELWKDGWNAKGASRDPFLWINGRMLYGARDDYPSWHQTVFSELHLRSLFERVGLTDIRRMEENEVRGHNHGWINLGLTGRKP